MTNELTAAADQDPAELLVCTLSDHDLRTQTERWRAVAENFGISRTAARDGIRLTFRYDPQVEVELRALLAVESDCCRWAAWAVDPGPNGELVMAARSLGDGVGTLHAMFTEPEFKRLAGID